MTFLYTNNAAGTLAAAVAAGDLSLTLNAGQAAAFPVPTTSDTFFATITDALTQSFIEIVLVTNVNGNVFTIVRGQDGTSPRSWNANDIISRRIVAAEARQWAASVIPSGFIGLWSGAANAIPEGWLLCDGTSGTPNLKDRFVVGAGGAYAVGATGGNASITLTTAQLPAHNHAVNDPGHNHVVSDPGHSHNIPASVSTFSNGPANALASFGSISTGLSTTGIQLSVATTGITTQNTGTGAAIDARPPYYALCFIMKA